MRIAISSQVLFSIRRLLLTVILVVSQFGCNPAAAQDAVGGAQLLENSESLGVDAIIEAALANAPAARRGGSLLAMSNAFSALSESWISGRPSLQMNYYDDSALDDIGLREFESGISFNLWRPGERDDTAALGDHHRSRLEAWRGHLELQIAGQVRTVLAEMAAAERMLEIAQQATADAERLLETTLIMEQAGSVSQSDVLQSRTQLLQQQRQELQVLTDLVSVEQVYRALTGLSIKPASRFSESAVADVEIPPGHPTLSYLQSQVAIAAANVLLTRHQSDGRANVTVGVRRERGDRFQPFVDSLAVSLSLPFGKSATTTASVSLARGDQVDAEVELMETRRLLQQRRGQIDRELALMGESAQLGQEQLMIAQQRYEMALAAFELGEMDLTRVIIAQQQARQAQMDYETLRLRRQRLNSEYNQIMGVLP